VPDEQTRIEFPGTGGHRLVGRIHRPGGEPVAWALFAHCFTCSKDIQAAVRIGRALAQRGVAILRFDFTGLGESEGDFADTTFSSNVGDLVAAAGHLRTSFGPPRILLGHSLGGAAVLSAAARIPEAVAVATIGAPHDPAHVKRLLAPARAELEARGEAEVVIAGRPFRVRRELIEDLEAQEARGTIASLGKALLVLHSPQDEVVSVENARRIFEAARHPKSFVSLDGADHLLRRESDAVYVGEIVSAWASRYLG